MLSSRVSKNHGTRFLCTSSKARGCLGASILSSVDTFVRTIMSYSIYMCINIYIIAEITFIDFMFFLTYSSPNFSQSFSFLSLQMLEKRISN